MSTLVNSVTPSNRNHIDVTAGRVSWKEKRRGYPIIDHTVLHFTATSIQFYLDTLHCSRANSLLYQNDLFTMRTRSISRAHTEPPILEKNFETWQNMEILI